MKALLRDSLPAILGLGLFAATLGAEFGVLWAWHTQVSRAYSTAPVEMTAPAGPAWQRAGGASRGLGAALQGLGAGAQGLGAAPDGLATSPQAQGAGPLGFGAAAQGPGAESQAPVSLPVPGDGDGRGQGLKHGGGPEHVGGEPGPGAGPGNGAERGGPGLLERLPGREPGGPEWPEGRRGRLRLAIVIDDWGYDWHAADAFFSLDVPLTVAIIPFLPHSREQALEARRHGFEVLVHLPMEPEDPHVNPGVNAITTDLPDEEIRRRVELAIDAIPGAVGVSNHMGSRATADPRVMAQVLAVVAQRGLFFLDSYTTPRSVVGELASAMGVRWARNHLFLDGQPEVGAVRRRLEQAVRRGLTRGRAIVIGHVRPATAAAIASLLPELRRRGVEVVPVSALVQP